MIMKINSRRRHLVLQKALCANLVCLVCGRLALVASGDFSAHSVRALQLLLQNGSGGAAKAV